MVAPDEMDLLGVDALEGQKQTDGFEGVAAPVDEIPQKDVVEVFDVFLLSCFVRGTVEVEEAHEVSELPVNVTEDLEGRLGL